VHFLNIYKNCRCICALESNIERANYVFCVDVCVRACACGWVHVHVHLCERVRVWLGVCGTFLNVLGSVLNLQGPVGDTQGDLKV
jgi:hypothetical protein